MKMHFNLNRTTDAVAKILGRHFKPLHRDDEEEMDLCHYIYFDRLEQAVFELYFDHGQWAILTENTRGAWVYDGPAHNFPGHLFEDTTGAVVFSGEVLERHHVDSLSLNSASLLAEIYAVMSRIPSLAEITGSLYAKEDTHRRAGEKLFATTLAAFQQAEMVNDHLRKLGVGDKTGLSNCWVGAAKGMLHYLPHLNIRVSIAGRQMETSFPVTGVTAKHEFETEVRPWLDSIASVIDKDRRLQKPCT